MQRQNQLEKIINLTMNSRIYSVLFCLMILSAVVAAQSISKKMENVQISTTHARLMGKSTPMRTAVLKATTPKIKKQNSKIEKKVPDNFRERKNQSKAVRLDKEHQGVDAVWQSEVNLKMGKEIEVLANMQGRGIGSPTDPTGDVNEQYYVQAVNATDVGVYNLDGSLEFAFPMNTLWSQFNESSEGDPIILFDEILDKWILTEFSDPANVLIAFSETNDPLGSYFAYSFSTPSFPDYPKYAITPDALVITTNEGGSSSLHQYFLDKAAMAVGEDGVTIQRLSLPGTIGSEQGFYVSTPVDWNGTNLPYDSRPVVIRINDSSWSDGPPEDQIEIYSFDVDFENPDNTSVEQSSVVISPFDGFPCSVSGQGFQCIPQMNGGGLDGIPEVIMNVPHQRNFGTHESMVFSFVTDATNGDNVAAVRWVELRRTATTDWALYQEGTYGPNDGLQRFMSSIAIDSKGNICLGYSVSSSDSFAGLRATGRNKGDPLGQMTFDELIIREGQSTINSNGRYGDYSQMSVAPGGFSNFWFTSEYAGPNFTISNIVGMRLEKEPFDLALASIITPTGQSDAFGAAETVKVSVRNVGANTIESYTVSLFLEGALIERILVNDAIAENESREFTFTNTLDLSAIRDYNIRATVGAVGDTNPQNDAFSTVTSKLPLIEASLMGTISVITCDQTVSGELELLNLGGRNITSAKIGLLLNGVPLNDIVFDGSFAYNETALIGITLDEDLLLGENELVATINSINNQSNDFNNANNSVTLTTTILSPDDFITIGFETDQYNEESSYTLLTINGEVITTTTAFAEGFTFYEDVICASKDSCFTLIVEDSYGDGICCDFGAGYVFVLNHLGDTIVYSDGDFGSEFVIDFCADGIDCFLNANIQITPSTTADSNNGIIMINAKHGVEPYQYSITGGSSFQSSNVFDGLRPGAYSVFVKDADDTCTYEEEVIITFNTATHQLSGSTVDVQINPNPTDGIFEIRVNNLTIDENFLEVRIYDIQGKMLQHRDIGKYDDTYVGTFSLYAYPPGTYLINIITPIGNILEKLVRQ